MKYKIGQTVWRLNYENKAKEIDVIGVLATKDKENNITYHYQFSIIPMYENEDLSDISELLPMFFIEERKLFASKEELIASL